MDLVVDTPSGRVARPLRRLGKYELFAKIAAGGMAEVYLARLRGPMNFQKAVVVKVIHPQLASQDEFLRMLFDEARLSALIRHPRAVDIYELGRADGQYFIAMEYLDGEPLAAVMSAGRKGNNLDPLSTARLIADAADGLHAAHELKTSSGTLVGLVHRDVSPGNIMVLHDGTAKIVDFGVAKARGRLTVSGAMQFKGKLGYVAPEQMTGAPVDRRADVYGLGVVMWEALLLQRFRTDVDKDAPMSYVHRPPQPPSALRPDIPDDLSDICMRALAIAPEDRYQTAGDMRDDIEAALHRAHYYREGGAIRRYMSQVFGDQHEARQRSIRRLAAISHSGEHEIIVDEDVDIDHEDLEALEPAAPTTGTEVTHLARGTPTPAATTEVAPSRAGRLILALLLVLAGTGGAVVWKYLGPSQDADAEVATAPQEPALRAPALAPAAPETTAASPTPAAPTPEPITAPADITQPSTPSPSTPPPPTPDRPRETKKPGQLYDEGAKLFMQGNLRGAKERFKQALAGDSRHAAAHRGLGLVYAAEGNRSKAVSSFERYLKLRPSAADAPAIRKRIEQLK